MDYKKHIEGEKPFTIPRKAFCYGGASHATQVQICPKCAGFYKDDEDVWHGLDEDGHLLTDADWQDFGDEVEAGAVHIVSDIPANCWWRLKGNEGMTPIDW